MPCVAIRYTPVKEMATPVQRRARMRSPSAVVSNRMKIGVVERYRMPLAAVV
jgi:hypothetical protein